MKAYNTVNTVNTVNKNEDRFTLPLIHGKDTYNINPTVFKKVIGQKEACKKLGFFVQSHSKVTPMPTMLFSGSQGLGKTYMAEKVAKALGRELIEVNCGTIEKAKDFIDGILFKKVMGDKSKTILLDEAHKLSSEITTILLSLLNPNAENINYLSYKNWVVEFDMSKINIIFASTDGHRIFKPLLNRCVEIYFHTYSNKNLFRILKLYSKGVSIECDAVDVSYACRGRARDAFVLSQNILRHSIMNNKKVFDTSSWADVREIFGIHEYGLNNQEVELLKTIKDNAPISCRNLAVKLGVNESNIESELEIRPRELGFIKNGTRGRKLSEEGLEYLKGKK